MPKKKGINIVTGIIIVMLVLFIAISLVSSISALTGNGIWNWLI